MKPKIQLVGGCASTYVNELVSARVPDSGNDGSAAQSARSSETAVLLERFLQTIIRSVEAGAGIIRVKSPNGQELRTVGTAGITGTCQAGSVMDSECGVCGKSATKRNIELSNIDYCKTQYGEDFLSGEGKYVLAMPFGDAAIEGEPSGVVTLFFASEQVVTESLRRTLESYAELIQITLQSVWKSEDVHQSHLLDERQSIANEIHDSLAQTLYFAKIRSSLLLDAMKSDNELLSYKCAQDIEEALESSQKSVRELVTHFRCQMDPKGLRYALRKLSKDFIARTNIALKYKNQIEDLQFPKEFELQIFLIVREALVNIATHSGATMASLMVTRTDGLYQFVIEDNGAGLGNGEPDDGHYGLEIMRERALRIGGEVNVSSLQGMGTRVQLTFVAPEA